MKMWILVKHPPPQDGAGTSQFYLLAGRKYVLGRKDCDIVIPGDISISRRHAVINLSDVTSNDPNLTVENITITDTSKVGILVNAKKITPNEAIEIKNNDFISFGRMHIKYRLVYQRLAVVTSCISSSSSKSSVKTCVKKLGGYILPNWSEKATHLVMEKVTFTLKVVCAIASGKHVVSVKYLDDLLDCCDKKTGKALPLEKDYLPPISEQSLIQHEQLFYPNDKRSVLLVGKMFITLHSQQYKRIKDSIQFAGGDVVLKDSKDMKLVKGLSSSQMIVMQVEKKDEMSMSEEQLSWMNQVYSQLKKHNLRPIRESEVGLAILHISLTQYCNPTLKSAPSVTGTTHTQVFADSISVNTQQTQMDMNDDATQPLEQSQVYQPVVIARKNTSQQPSAKTIPVESNTTNETDETNATLKRKRTLDSNTDCQEKVDKTSVKKTKIKEEPSSIIIADDELDDLMSSTISKQTENTNNIPLDTHHKKTGKDHLNRLSSPTTQTKNIITIDDDEDEEDVFSFNYSKSISYPHRTDSTQSTTIQTNAVSVQQQPINPESDVLFKSLSRRAEKVPDSCQSSAMSPATKRLANDTLLPSAVTPLAKKPMLDISSENISVPESISLYDRNEGTRPETETLRLENKRSNYNNAPESDDDDDPFSFSVNTAATCKSTAREKTKQKDRVGQSNKDKVDPSNKDKLDQSNKGDQIITSDQRDDPTKRKVVSDKLVSDSDTSLNRSSISEEEKQNSRYLKAMSSSQDSDPDSLYLSDGAGGLVRAERGASDQKPVVPPPELLSTEVNKENDADLSHLLEDNDDLGGDLVNEECSDRETKCLQLNGFISSDDLHPRSSIKEENDGESFGRNTDLVQTVFVPLVVKQPKVRKAPPKIAANPKSRLKNFKCFKKQNFAGRNKSKDMIGKRDLVVFTSDNVERASLFAEIREKDEEEARENRRIDKMFEMAPSGKSRRR